MGCPLRETRNKNPSSLHPTRSMFLVQGAFQDSGIVLANRVLAVLQCKDVPAY